MQDASLWSLLRKAFQMWSDHEAPRLGASLAFYTILSLAPLVILLLAIVALFFGHSAAQNEIIGYVGGIIGQDGANAVRVVIEHAAQKPASGTFASIVGVITLLFGASGVLDELRLALNKVWNIPSGSAAGMWRTIQQRFFSFGMVLAVGFLLLVSLVLSAGLAAVGKFFGGVLPLPEFLLSGMNFAVSFMGTWLLFALIFKYLPETRMVWKDIWLGAIATALFFTIGKHLVGLYLGKAAVGSPYGAAGSVVVLIVWVYYSAMIFLFGAEFTHVLKTAQSKQIELFGRRHFHSRPVHASEL